MRPLPRAPWVRVPTADTIIMAGKNRNIGLRTEAPEVRYSTPIPAIAATMATGISRVNGFPGVDFGGSGGGSTTIWPHGMTGG